MFREEEIIEFVNRILNTIDTNEEDMRYTIKQFYQYLKLTKMTNQETLDKLSVTIDHFDEIIEMKRHNAMIDIRPLFFKEETRKSEKEKKYYRRFTKPNRHYEAYESTDYACHCGVGHSMIRHC